MEKKIKSAEEVLELEVSDYHWNTIQSTAMLKEWVIEAIKEYARIKIEEQLEIAANEANVNTGWDLVSVVNRDSIRNCTRVSLD